VTTTRSAWIAGLTVGVGAGVLALTLPTVGWGIGAAFVVGALLSSARVAALGGLAVGAGAAWLVLLGQSVAACREFDGPGRECIEPDLTPWLMTSVASLVAGSVATLVAAARRGALGRRPEAGGRT
jgi:hypothetical protein